MTSDLGPTTGSSDADVSAELVPPVDASVSVRSAPAGFPIRNSRLSCSEGPRPFPLFAPNDVKARPLVRRARAVGEGEVRCSL